MTFEVVNHVAIVGELAAHQDYPICYLRFGYLYREAIFVTQIVICHFLGKLGSLGWTLDWRTFVSMLDTQVGMIQSIPSIALLFTWFIRKQPKIDLGESGQQCVFW